MASASTKTRTRNAKPKPPPRVRVAVKAPPLNDPAAMATMAHKLVTAATDNPTIIVSPPYLTQLSAAATTLSLAVIAAQGGSDATQTALVTATVKTHGLIIQHGAWVQGVANDMTPTDAVNLITTAGFQVAKSPHRAPKTQPEISNGAQGVIHFELPSIPGAIMWFTEISTDGGHTYTRATDTEHLKGDITGLTSGQNYMVHLRPFVRGSGYAAWTTLSIFVT